MTVIPLLVLMNDGDVSMLDAPGRIRAIVIVQVGEARPLISPGYDNVADEASMRAHWIKYYLGDKGAV